MKHKTGLNRILQKLYALLDWKQKRNFIFILIIMAVSAILAQLTPKAIGWLTDDILMQEQLDLAAAQAESSQKESKIALAISFASLLLSVLGLVLQNLDTLGKLFSQIMR